MAASPRVCRGRCSAARERITSYLEPHSVWLHNSLRGAAGLGLAVLAARLTGVQHSFWVVLGALSVLRSNALNTGQDAVRAMPGTVAGFIVGAALLAGIGTNTTLLWFLLPLAVFLAGVAPAGISFAGGQAAFTLTVVILFSILQPTGWRVGLVRIEDVAIGVGVSLVVGVLFWPRGAAPALRQALAEAYADGAGYLASTVRFGMSRGDPSTPRTRSVAATRPGPLRHRAGSMTRSARTWPSAARNGSRLPMWPGWSPGSPDCAWRPTRYWTSGEATTAKQAATWPLHATRSWAPLNASRGWYDGLATTMITGGELPQPLAHDKAADGRLVRAVRRDLLGDDGRASATAVRMIWTGDHLDVIRRLQAAIISPARATAGQPAGGRIIPPLPRRFLALLR